MDNKERARQIADELIPDQDSTIRQIQYVTALAAARKAIPEGYVLVPKEPTEAMMQAADGITYPRFIKAIYKAMLEVANGERNRV